MVDKSCSQASPPVRLPDEDGVNDVQAVALKTSSPRHWPTFAFESAEADGCSFHPAQQGLTMSENRTHPTLLSTHGVLCVRQGIVRLVFLIVWRLVEIVDNVVQDRLQPPLVLRHRNFPTI